MRQVDQVMGHKHDVVAGLEGGGRNLALQLEQKSVRKMRDLVAKFGKCGQLVVN